MKHLADDRRQSAKQDEEGRAARLLAWLSAMALLFLLGIGAKSWFSGHGTHAVVLWCFAVLVALNILAFLKTRDPSQHKVGLLIVVSVALDLVQKIDSHLIMRNYPGLLESDA